MARMKKTMVRKTEGPKHFIMKATEKRVKRGTGGSRDHTDLDWGQWHSEKSGSSRCRQTS